MLFMDQAGASLNSVQPALAQAWTLNYNTQARLGLFIWGRLINGPALD